MKQIQAETIKPESEFNPVDLTTFQRYEAQRLVIYGRRNFIMHEDIRQKNC
jgi:hypothetical protein